MTPDSALKFKTLHFTKPLLLFSSLAVALSLLVWSLHNYRWPRIFYGPRAIYSMMALSIALALLGRYLLLRMIKRESGMTRILYHRLPLSWQMLFLFDITAPIYLAAGVLVGVSAAVLTALVTQTALQLFTYTRRFVSLAEASYRIASTALIVLVADGVFISIVGTQKSQVVDNYSKLTESNELLGCIFAALVMLLLLTRGVRPLALDMGIQAAPPAGGEPTSQDSQGCHRLTCVLPWSILFLVLCTLTTHYCLGVPG